MGKVTEQLVEVLKRQVADRGLVVWYDPQRAYADLAKQLELPGTAILRYEDGFFRAPLKDLPVELGI